jgi:glycosyltransferase involved in cell wall biosynthesis
MSLQVVCDGRPLQPGFKAHRERGIGRYAKNLLTAMTQLADPPELELLVQANLPDPGLLDDLPRLSTGYAPAWLPIGKRIISHHGLARRAMAGPWREGKVVHFLSHLDSPCRVEPRTVVTVHDLIAQKLAKLYGQGKSGARFRLERWLETRCLYGAAAIIAVSQCSKDDLVDLYGIPAQRITVIHEAADPGLQPVQDVDARRRAMERHGLDSATPFFLYLGGIDQRKDLGTLLAALAELKDRGLDFALALAGKISGDKQYPTLIAEIERQGLKDRVRQLGFVPDADLPALFSACAAFVFPSLYEGFGLPPLEAMACGAAVVAVDASAVPEVVGRAGILVPPGQAGVLGQALEGILTNPELAGELKEQGRRRAGLFSWSRAAAETLEVYREVARAG